MTEAFAQGYLEKLKVRRARSKPVSHGHQMTGLTIASLLHDRAHTHLYLRLAREYDNGALLSLAKDVTARKDVENWGAYFMRRFQQTKTTIRRIAAPRQTQRKLPLRTSRRSRSRK